MLRLPSGRLLCLSGAAQRVFGRLPARREADASHISMDVEELAAIDRLATRPATLGAQGRNLIGRVAVEAPDNLAGFGLHGDFVIAEQAGHGRLLCLSG